MKVINISLKIFIIAIYLVSIFYMVDVNVIHIIFIAVFLLISDIVQSLIHETGHFIGGRLSFYNLLMFHIGPFRLLKKEGANRSFLFSLDKDIYSQCVMIPKREKYGLYNISGILLNFLSVIILTAIILLNGKEPNQIIFIFMSSLLAVGIIKIESNIIPLCIKNCPNDMMIINMLSSSRKTQKDYYNYLKNYEKAAYNLPIIVDDMNIDFNQKDIDHYSPFFADALDDLIRAI